MRSSRASVSRRLALLLAAAGIFAFAPLAEAQPETPATEAVPGSDQGETIELAQLLSAFAAMPGLEASFVEEKHLGMLARPLTSSGTLYFTQPGLLHRRVDSPRPSTVVITPDTLRFTDESGTEEIDLRSRADVRLFVESLVWILAGDQAALDATYESEFSADSERWTLVLTPRDSPLADVIATLTISGTGLNVEEIRVDETIGDATVTRISQANPHRTFDDAERAELFGDGSL